MGWKRFSNGWLWLDGLDRCDLCCDELVICAVSLGIGRVPHPGSARKPQPMLQVLVGMQKLLSDRQEIFFERICQRPTSRTNNLMECFPRAKISRSFIVHFFHSLNMSKKSIDVGASAGVAGLVSA